LTSRSSKSEHNQDFNWPKGKEKVLAPSNDYRANFDLENDPERRLSLMVSGYKEAAEVLISEAKTPWQKNTLIFPILHSYRHFLELGLKQIVLLFGGDVGVEPNWKEHSLTRQWKKVQEILQEFGVETDADADGKVNRAIEQFNAVDNKSMTFRYSYDPSGNPLDLALSQIDVFRLSRDMDALYNYFSGTIGYLGSSQDATGYHDL